MNEKEDTDWAEVVFMVVIISIVLMVFLSSCSFKITVGDSSFSLNEKNLTKGTK